MEIWSIGFLIGALTATIFVGIGVIFGRIDKRFNQRELANDTDIRLYVPSRDRNRGGDNGLSERERTGNEEINIIGVLESMQLGATQTERNAIDYAVESITIRKKVEAWLDNLDSRITDNAG